MPPDETEDDAFMREHLAQLRRRKRKVRLIWATVIGLPILTVIGLRVTAAIMLRAELQAMRDSGVPMVFSDLIAELPEPNKRIREAQKMFLAALDLQQPSSPEDDELFVAVSYNVQEAMDKLTEAQWQHLARYVADHQAMLDQMHQALDAGPLFHREMWDEDGTSRGDQRLTHPGHFRSLAILLKYHSLLAFKQNDADQAIRQANGLWKLAHHIGQTYTSLIKRLTANAIGFMAAETTEAVVNRFDLTDEQLATLIGLIGQAEPDDRLGGAMAEQHVYGLMEYDAIREGDKRNYGPFKDSPAIVPYLYHLSGLIDLDQLAFLKATAEIIEISNGPLPQRLADARAYAFDSSGLRGLATAIAQESVFSPARVVELDARSRAMTSVACVALAVQRYRLRHGRLPVALSDLVPEFLDAVPTDPFSGKPLILAPLDEGFTVYSVGKDQTDDGGARFNSLGAKFDTGSDIPFVITR